MGIQLSKATAEIFQFLLVRLKERNQRNIHNKTRRFQFLLVRLKEGKPVVTRQYIPEFQFLLVRLKDANSPVNSPDRQISIPFGAIKSKQFYSINRFISYFNSFWCD